MDTWTVAFSPDSRLIATGSHAGKISLIGVESGKKESALDTRGKFTMSIAYVSYKCSFINMTIQYMYMQFKFSDITNNYVLTKFRINLVFAYNSLISKL